MASSGSSLAQHVTFKFPAAGDNVDNLQVVVEFKFGTTKSDASHTKAELKLKPQVRDGPLCRAKEESVCNAAGVLVPEKKAKLELDNGYLRFILCTKEMQDIGNDQDL